MNRLTGLMAACAFWAGLSADMVTLADHSDADADGVFDEVDECPEPLPGSSGFDARGCPTVFDREAELVFEHDKHRSWYRRFWTGRCDGLSIFDRCLPGSPFWEGVVGDTLQRTSEGDRPRLRYRLWTLGRVVGHEWARDNDVRRIDTDDVRRWGEKLGAASDAETAIEEIMAAAAGRL